jgi:hypothetical protein
VRWSAPSGDELSALRLGVSCPVVAHRCLIVRKSISPGGGLAERPGLLAIRPPSPRRQQVSLAVARVRPENPAIGEVRRS